MKSQVSSDKFWDKVADRYAKMSVSDMATYEKKLTETQSFFEPDMHILEFGCGTGATAILHATYVQHIDAIDISEKMLEIGRSKAKEAGIENIEFTHGDLEAFNAESASLDAVLALNVLHLLANRQATIAEVARILKPGGIFVSSTICLGHSYLRFIKLAAALGKRLGLMPNISILTEAKLENEITNAGFAIERQWHHGINDIRVFIIARKI
ncbi:class I SAM-dependent methyltransferase [Psychrobacter sp. CAL346-MNA-CIBAN-0220]|uniref:class I SAM-dependent methyltransferase n=1 Tax=Psychrobacter sp. CAL346-MNA-CIBAN-0220 TaxID=3140457 RepID=UPI0033245D65